jgi:hypothetical protein
LRPRKYTTNQQNKKFLKKMNKIDKPLATLARQKGGKAKLINNEKGDITTNTNGIQRIIRGKSERNE